MSKKKKIQIVAIVFLIFAIFLLIPNTDWKNSTSIYGFIILIFGTIGSIISIFIPTNYIYPFYKKNWTKGNEEKYQLFITSKKHGMGKAPHVQIFEEVNDSFEEVEVENKHNKKGNVIIEAESTFDGKVIITS